METNRRTDTTYACPVVGRRELLRRQQMHRDRLQNMKSALDTSAPSAQPHLTLYGRDYVAKKRATTEAAFSDLKMIQSIARTMTRKPGWAEERKGPVSLNADGRKHEIYRIMSENHKLLDHIENVGAFMKTTDAIKDHAYRMRYVINSSHTMRLSGDYDQEIARIRREEETLSESKHRATQLRRERLMRKTAGSVSLPTLSPNGQRGMETQSPPEGHGRAGRGREGPSSSSSSFNSSQHGRGHGHGGFAQTAPGSIAAVHAENQRKQQDRPKQEQPLPQEQQKQEEQREQHTEEMPVRQETAVQLEESLQQQPEQPEQHTEQLPEQKAQEEAQEGQTEHQPPESQEQAANPPTAVADPQPVRAEVAEQAPDGAPSAPTSRLDAPVPTAEEPQEKEPCVGIPGLSQEQTFDQKDTEAVEDSHLPGEATEDYEETFEAEEQTFEAENESAA